MKPVCSLVGLYFPLYSTGDPFLIGRVDCMVNDQTFAATMHHSQTGKVCHVQTFPAASWHSLHFHRTWKVAAAEGAAE